jgi:predicted O-linked N-acetylglucosamine transferase (SPINDLY family)
LVGHSAEDYVKKAAALAADAAQIAELRSTLRERMAHSALMDAAGFARRVEDAYRRMMHAAYAGSQFA